MANRATLSGVFPYKDDNPTVLPPIVTIGIIVLNVLAWVFLQGAGASEPLGASVCQLGLIPGELLGTVPPGTSVNGIDPTSRPAGLRKSGRRRSASA